jgi:hypothetical protein
VYIFAFSIGFSTTIAEPSLLAVAIKANQVSGGSIKIWPLRIVVSSKLVCHNFSYWEKCFFQSNDKQR